jgi:hypothetical protein
MKCYSLSKSRARICARGSTVRLCSAILRLTLLSQQEWHKCREMTCTSAHVGFPSFSNHRYRLWSNEELWRGVVSWKSADVSEECVARNKRQSRFQAILCLAYSSNMKMEPICSSETSEDVTLHFCIILYRWFECRYDTATDDEMTDGRKWIFKEAVVV